MSGGFWVGWWAGEPGRRVQGSGWSRLAWGTRAPQSPLLAPGAAEVTPQQTTLTRAENLCLPEQACLFEDRERKRPQVTAAARGVDTGQFPLLSNLTLPATIKDGLFPVKEDVAQPVLSPPFHQDTRGDRAAPEGASGDRSRLGGLRAANHPSRPLSAHQAQIPSLRAQNPGWGQPSAACEARALCMLPIMLRHICPGAGC